MQVDIKHRKGTGKLYSNCLQYSYTQWLRNGYFLIGSTKGMNWSQIFSFGLVHFLYYGTSIFYNEAVLMYNFCN